MPTKIAVDSSCENDKTRKLENYRIPQDYYLTCISISAVMACKNPHAWKRESIPANLSYFLNVVLSFPNCTNLEGKQALLWLKSLQLLGAMSVMPFWCLFVSKKVPDNAMTSQSSIVLNKEN